MQTWVRTLKTLGHTLPTAATVLAGVGRWHGDDSTPSVCCLGFEDGTELRPARIADALGEVAIPHHVGDLQIFEIDGVVVAEQLQRRLVVEVGALPLHRLMRPLAGCPPPCAGGGCPSCAGDAALRLRQSSSRPADSRRGFSTTVPVGGDEEHLQPDINARLLSGGWQRLQLGTSAHEMTAYQPSASLTRW